MKVNCSRCNTPVVVSGTSSVSCPNCGAPVYKQVAAERIKSDPRRSHTKDKRRSIDRRKGGGL